MNVFNIQINHPSLVESIQLYLYHWNQCFCSFNMIKRYFDNIIVSKNARVHKKSHSMYFFNIQCCSFSKGTVKLCIFESLTR